MTNTVTNILSHDEELALRKPIEDYVGKIQAEIDELREEGTNKVLEYSEEIEVLKRDKIYTKSEKEARKKQKTFDIKEVKLRPGIEDHDFNVKYKNAVRFLEDGDKVKVTIMFRGRELSHPELGEVLLKKMAEQLKDMAVIERAPKLEGRNMIMIVAPKATK